MLHTLLTVLHVLFALGLIAFVLLQSGKSAGLSGSIAGGAEQIFGKKKGMDDLLARYSTVTAVLFIATSLVLTFLSRF
jgi:preprotein translocase subunit SecG